MRNCQISRLGVRGRRIKQLRGAGGAARGAAGALLGRKGAGGALWPGERGEKEARYLVPQKKPNNPPTKVHPRPRCGRPVAAGGPGGSRGPSLAKGPPGRTARWVDRPAAPPHLPGVRGLGSVVTYSHFQP